MEVVGAAPAQGTSAEPCWSRREGSETFRVSSSFAPSAVGVGPLPIGEDARGKVRVTKWETFPRWLRLQTSAGLLSVLLVVGKHLFCLSKWFSAARLFLR